MSLRTRIAGAAGLAVALAVIAVAAAVYLGVRAELRGEVDDSLRARASIAFDGAAAGAVGPGPAVGREDSRPEGHSRRSAEPRATCSWCFPAAG